MPQTVLFLLFSSVLLLFLLPSVSSELNNEVQSVTGLGKTAIELSAGASLKLPYELSAFLGNSFTFECWIWFDSPADGAYKPIVYRGPGTSNHHNEFLLQVNPAGRLVFFMGNGNSVTTYGVLGVSTSTLAPKKWTHIGFAIQTEEWRVNPSKISVYFGDRVDELSWGQGTRQYRPDKPVYIGTYANPDVHWLKGKLDEIRFWDEYRSLSQVEALKNLPPPLDHVHLKAYYDCNTKDFKVIKDKTKLRYDAQILRSSLNGEGANFTASGVKIHKLYSFAYETEIKMVNRNFLLDKLDDNSLVYYIESLPAEGSLWDAHREKPLTPKDLPYKLDNSAHISYDTTTTPSITSFRVYGARKMKDSPDYDYRAEEESTIVYIKTDVKSKEPVTGRVSYGKPSFCSDKSICTEKCRKGL